MTRFLIGLLLGAAQPALPPASASCDGPAGDCAALAALNARWLGSYVTRDAAALEEILAPEFIAVHGGGIRRSRDDLLAGMRNRRRPIVAVAAENLHVQVVGDTAIVTARSVLRLGGDGADAEIRNDYADTYVRRDGRWRAISAHVVRASPQDSRGLGGAVPQPGCRSPR